MKPARCASRRFVLAALLLVACAGAARAADSSAADTGRFVLRTLPLGHESHPYVTWLPPGFDRRRAWPAILFLHGSGECGTDPMAPVRIGLGPALVAHPERWPYVVVFPQKASSEEEWEEREAQVLATLDDAVRAFGIDPKRVALSGMSQGGHGAWMIGARHPGRWVCLVPIAGYGRARTIEGRAARLPVWAFHGLRDDLVDPRDTRNIVAGLRARRMELGLDPDGARLTLFPDANHDSWDPAFAHDSLVVWLRARLGVSAAR